MANDILLFSTGQVNNLGTADTPYLALFTNTAAETEVANSNAYARVDSTGDWGSTAAGTGGFLRDISNTSEIAWAEATGSWGTVDGVGIYDSGTYGGGNLLHKQTLTASRLVDTGTTFRFPIGDLTLRAK